MKQFLQIPRWKKKKKPTRWREFCSSKDCRWIQHFFCYVSYILSRLHSHISFAAQCERRQSSWCEGEWKCISGQTVCFLRCLAPSSRAPLSSKGRWGPCWQLSDSDSRFLGRPHAYTALYRAAYLTHITSVSVGLISHLHWDSSPSEWVNICFNSCKRNHQLGSGESFLKRKLLPFLQQWSIMLQQLFCFVLFLKDKLQRYWAPAIPIKKDFCESSDIAHFVPRSPSPSLIESLLPPRADKPAAQFLLFFNDLISLQRILMLRYCNHRD